jgi:cysteine-rich repeat protein
VSPGEGCDDGNRVDGDGCDANCTATGCGNAVVTAGEACDDGNVVSGDGCDANCTPTGCGNGVTTAAEECDDANAVEGDGCEPGCRLTVCAGGMRIEKPMIRIFNLGPPFGDEDLVFSGVLRVDRETVEPGEDGLQVLIEESRPGGSRLLALTHVTHPIPPGGMGSGCHRWDGWRTGWWERRFVYRNVSGSVDPPACTPRSAGGLDFVELHSYGRRGHRPVSFDVVALNTKLTRPIGALRAVLVLGARAEDGMAGRCASHVFAGFACDFDSKRRTLTCK